MSRVALLETGAMGSRTLQNLLNADHLVVYNRTESKVKSLLSQGAVYLAKP